MRGLGMDNMEILELDSFEVPFSMTEEEQDRYRRRFMTLFVPPASDALRGGSGRVDKVRNAQGEVFAMKRISPINPRGMSEESYKRQRRAQEDAFRKEFENQQPLSKLKGFPKLYGYGKANGEPLIVMEWIEGRTVGKAEELRAADPLGKRVPPLLVAQLGADLYDLISRFEYLDDSFAHRDISANNIMLRTDRMSIREQLDRTNPGKSKLDLCLIDFGSATLHRSVLDPTFTMEAGVLRKGTPEYAPPEMLTSDLPNMKERQSPLIDVYAMGSVLYELMCGETPYRLSKLDRLPESYYRYKLEHAVPLPVSMHVDLRSASNISDEEPHLKAAFTRALQQGNFDDMRFVNAVNVTDQQLGYILMQAIEAKQKDRATAWDMCDMLSRFAKNYEENILRHYNGKSLLPFRDVDHIARKPSNPIPLGQVAARQSATVLVPQGGVAMQGTGPMQPASVTAWTAAAGFTESAEPTEPTSIVVPAVVTGLLAAGLALLFSLGAHGQPGTLNLFGKVFSGSVPFLACFLGCLLPVAASIPFYWLSPDSGKRFLFGVAAMTVIAAVVWWLVHITSWVSPAVEPMWALVLVLVLCICAVGAWTMINMREG